MIDLTIWRLQQPKIMVYYSTVSEQYDWMKNKKCQLYKKQNLYMLDLVGAPVIPRDRNYPQKKRL